MSTVPHGQFGLYMAFDPCHLFNFSCWSTWYACFLEFRPLKASRSLFPALAFATHCDESSTHRRKEERIKRRILVHSWSACQYKGGGFKGKISGLWCRHLGGLLGPSPSPWGTPISARPGTDLIAYLIEDILLSVVKLVIWKNFWTPPNICVEFWGHPHPHGEPQHQQCQGLILEHIS